MEQLKKKSGPLPMYVWIGLVVVAGVGYMLWKRSQTASTAAAGTSSATGSSTVPASAGYAISGDTGAQGWSGYNNQGSPAVTSSAPGTIYTAITSGAEALGLANAQFPMYVNPAPGVYTPYTGGVAGIGNAMKLGWDTHATQLYYINPNPTSASTPESIAPAVAAAATAPVSAVNTPVLNPGAPAGAIAPSALTGPVGASTPPPAPLTGPAALAAASAGTPLYSSTGVPYTGG